MRAVRHAAAVLLVILIVPAASEAKGVLYATDFGTDNFSAFNLGENGLPTSLAGSPFATGDGPQALAVAPDGSRLYIGDDLESNLDVFNLAGTSPVPIAGSPFSMSAFSAGAAAITPDGRRAYVTDPFSNVVHGFDLAADGTPTELPQVATADHPQDIAISPDGRSLYVANFGANLVSAYAIAADGPPSPLPGSPYAAGDGPTALAISPTGDRLYATNVYSNDISAYAIAADGSLSPLADSPFSGANGPQGLALTPDGRRLYATGIWNGVYAFQVASDGSLAPFPSPFTDGREPVGDYHPLSIAISPDGERVYVANYESDDLTTFAIAPSGSLSALGSPTPIGGDNSSMASLAIRPDQGPRAALSVAPAGGLSVRLDAGGSVDPDGAIAEYEWDFGDGTSSHGADPNLTHTYPRPGDYTATVKAIDDEGCSTDFVSTGHAAYCNGSAAATATAAVTVKAPKPIKKTRPNKVAGIRIRARKVQRQRRASRGVIVVRLKAGAAEAVRIVAVGKIVVAKRGRVKRASVPLKRASGRAPARKLKKLALRPRTRKGAAKIAAALRHGARVKARIKLRFTDRAGAKATRTRAIRLR